MSAMRPAKNYDLTEITRLLLKMRDNCVRKAEGEAYDDPERKEKYEALNDAIDLINNPSMLQRWISIEERLPEDDDSVLVIANGRYGNIKFVNAICMATYSGDEGWIIDNYEEWYGAEVDYWMPLPEPPEEEV